MQKEHHKLRMKGKKELMHEYQGVTTTGKTITGELAILDGIFYIVARDEYAGEMYYAVSPDSIQEANTERNIMKVRFKKLTPEAVIPKRGTPFSAGFDLTATHVEYDEDLYQIHYGAGIAVEIPEGYVGLLFPRSSIYKKNMALTNSVGVIDSDYRGEIKAVFRGANSDCYGIGERFAQLVIVPVPNVEYIESDTLTDTVRGTGGYGSTGR